MIYMSSLNFLWYFQVVIAGLKNRGHQTKRQDAMTSSVFAILVDENNEINAYIDKRFSSNVHPSGY